MAKHHRREKAEEEQKSNGMKQKEKRKDTRYYAMGKVLGAGSEIEHLVGTSPRATPSSNLRRSVRHE